MATKPQVKKKQTECPVCKKLIGNSGFKHHLTACEKKKKASDDKNKPQETPPEEPKPEENKPLEPDSIEMPKKKQSEDVVYVFDVLKDSGQIKDKKEKSDNWAKQAIEAVLDHSEEIQVFLAPLVLALAPKIPDEKEEKEQEKDW